MAKHTIIAYEILSKKLTIEADSVRQAGEIAENLYNAKEISHFHPSYFLATFRCPYCEAEYECKDLANDAICPCCNHPMFPLKEENK